MISINVIIKTDLLISEDICKSYQQRYANCTVDELDATMLNLVEEPMRSGLLERYSIVDTNSRGRC